MTDAPDGSGQIPRRSPRVGDGGAPVSGALAIVLAVVAVISGFLILRSISDDGNDSADFPEPGNGSANVGGDDGDAPSGRFAPDRFGAHTPDDHDVAGAHRRWRIGRRRECQRPGRQRQRDEPSHRGRRRIHGGRPDEREFHHSRSRRDGDLLRPGDAGGQGRGRIVGAGCSVASVPWRRCPIRRRRRMARSTARRSC